MLVLIQQIVWLPNSEVDLLNHHFHRNHRRPCRRHRQWHVAVITMNCCCYHHHQRIAVVAAVGARNAIRKSVSADK